MMTTLNPGDQLDCYQVESLVACGGMASPFRGRDTRTGATVALKGPHFEFESDPLFFDRFHREAEIGRQLDHPGVVKVLAQDDFSCVYMAMEWVEGTRLRELLGKEKKLAPDRAV